MRTEFTRRMAAARLLRIRSRASLSAADRAMLARRAAERIVSGPGCPYPLAQQHYMAAVRSRILGITNG